MILVHHAAGVGLLLSADRQCEGADGGASFVLFFFGEQGPGEGNGTFEIVSVRSVTDRAVVARKLKHHMELRQQRDDQLSAFFLLV